MSNLSCFQKLAVAVGQGSAQSGFWLTTRHYFDKRWDLPFLFTLGKILNIFQIRGVGMWGNIWLCGGRGPLLWPLMRVQPTPVETIPQLQCCYSCVEVTKRLSAWDKECKHWNETRTRLEGTIGWKSNENCTYMNARWFLKPEAINEQSSYVGEVQTKELRFFRHRLHLTSCNHQTGLAVSSKSSGSASRVEEQTSFTERADLRFHTFVSSSEVVLHPDGAPFSGIWNYSRNHLPDGNTTQSHCSYGVRALDTAKTPTSQKCGSYSVLTLTHKTSLDRSVKIVGYESELSRLCHSRFVDLWREHWFGSLLTGQQTRTIRILSTEKKKFGSWRWGKRRVSMSSDLDLTEGANVLVENLTEVCIRVHRVTTWSRRWMASTRFPARQDSLLLQQVCHLSSKRDMHWWADARFCHEDTNETPTLLASHCL